MNTFELMQYILVTAMLIIGLSIYIHYEDKTSKTDLTEYRKYELVD